MRGDGPPAGGTTNSEAGRGKERNCGRMPQPLSGQDSLPAAEFGGEILGHAGEGAGWRRGAEVKRVKEGGAGEGGVGEVARVAQVGREMIAAPKTGGVAGEGVVPAEHKPAGVGLVAKFPPGRRTDVVPDDATEGDEIDAAGIGGAEAEIDVFAAVDVGGVEAAEFFPKIATHGDAGAGHRHDAAVREGKRRKTRGERRGAAVLGLALEVDKNAGVIEGAAGGVNLEIADKPGARAVGAVGGEERLKPAGGEDEIVVEEDEELAAGDGGAGIVGGGVAEVLLVEHDADDGIGGEGFEPGTGAVGAAVVDEDDLVC